MLLSAYRLAPFLGPGPVHHGVGEVVGQQVGVPLQPQVVRVTKDRHLKKINTVIDT